MERAERHETVDQPIVPIDWIAIRALVDVLYEQSDARAFVILNNLLREIEK